MANMFEVIGDTDKVLISDTYKILCLSRTITLASASLIFNDSIKYTSHSSDSNTTKIYRIGLNSDEKLATMQTNVTNNNIVYAMVNNYYNSTRYVDIFVTTYNSASFSPSNVIIKIYGTGISATSTYGLQLYDASGNILYHSDTTPLKVIGKVDSTPSYSSLSTEISLSSGNNFAVFMPKPFTFTTRNVYESSTYVIIGYWGIVFKTDGTVKFKRNLWDFDDSNFRQYIGYYCGSMTVTLMQK